MSDVSLSDIEWLNLNLLAVMHASVQSDPVSTCARYGLSAEQAEWLRSISLDELWSLVLHVGDTLLFPPRADLVALTRLPRALAGPFALAREAPVSSPLGRHHECAG